MTSKLINDLLLVLVLIFTFMNAIFAFQPNIKKGHTEIGVYSFMNMDTCGYMSPKDVPKTKIVDGEQAKEGDFPWSAVLHFTNKSNPDTFKCGGVLLTFDWVLTAGHCVYQKDEALMKVSLGSVKKHEYHSIHNISVYYLVRRGDLALLKLQTRAKPILKEDHYLINTICLPKNKMLNNEHEEAIVSGFGAKDIKNSIQTNDLLKTVLVIDPYMDCLDKNFTLFDICATESIHQTCYGDSGSGLVQFDGNRAVLIGTVVGGTPVGKEICGPSVLKFTRISFFIDWLVYFLDNSARPNFNNSGLDKVPKMEPANEKAPSCVNKLEIQTILILILILFKILF